MKTRNAILAVTIGIIAGGLIGVLFAPDNGRETRKSLKKKRDALMNDMNHEVDKRFNELVRSLPDDYSRFMEEPLDEMAEV
jgi:gas vesicle protein